MLTIALQHSRLRRPFAGDDGARMVVSHDADEAPVFHFSTRPHAPVNRLRLTGFNPQAVCISDDGGRYTGAQLMGYDLPLPDAYGSYAGRVWHLRAKQ